MTELQHDDAPAEQAGASPDAPLYEGGPTMAQVWNDTHRDAPEMLLPEVDDFGFGDLDDDTAALLAAAAEPGPAPRSCYDDPAVREAIREQTASAAPEAEAEAAAPEAEAEAAAPEAEEAPKAEAPARTAPDVESVREAAEEIAMLDALKSWVGDELKAAKQRHAPMHADAANIGGSKTIPLKLDGVQIGTYNIAEPAIRTVWDDEAALAFAEANSPHNVYEEVDGTTAARYDDVIEYIRLTHPELITRKVRPAFLTTLVGQLDDECRLLDESTGELVTLAKRVPVESDGSGRCGWTRPKGKPGGREQLVAAWRSGKFKVRGALADGSPDK